MEQLCGETTHASYNAVEPVEAAVLKSINESLRGEMRQEQRRNERAVGALGVIEGLLAGATAVAAVLSAGIAPSAGALPIVFLFGAFAPVAYRTGSNWARTAREHSPS